MGTKEAYLRFVDIIINPWPRKTIFL